jgi:hypothetical protein
MSNCGLPQGKSAFIWTIFMSPSGVRGLGASVRRQAEGKLPHLDACQYRTTLHVAAAKVMQHSTRVEMSLRAEPASHLTGLCQRLVINRLAPKRSVSNWGCDEIHGVMEQAVARVAVVA